MNPWQLVVWYERMALWLWEFKRKAKQYFRAPRNSTPRRYYRQQLRELITTGSVQTYFQKTYDTCPQ